MMRQCLAFRRTRTPWTRTPRSPHAVHETIEYHRLGPGRNPPRAHNSSAAMLMIVAGSSEDGIKSSGKSAAQKAEWPKKNASEEHRLRVPRSTDRTAQTTSHRNISKTPFLWETRKKRKQNLIADRPLTTITTTSKALFFLDKPCMMRSFLAWHLQTTMIDARKLDPRRNGAVQSQSGTSTVRPLT